MKISYAQRILTMQGEESEQCNIQNLTRNILEWTITVVAAVTLGCSSGHADRSPICQNTWCSRQIHLVIGIARFLDTIKHIRGQTQDKRKRRSGLHCLQDP